LKSLALSFLSALLLVFSFPPADVWILAWGGFVPLFIALENKSFKESFCLSWFSGFLFFFGLLHWIHFVTWAGMVVLVLYLSLYFALFGAGICLLKKRWFLGVPFLWVFLEGLRSSLFTGFGWGLLGYSQWRFLPLIQIADLTGAYGVSFLVVLGNVVFYQLLRRRTQGKRLFISLLVFIFLFSSALGYGKTRLAPLPLPTFSASVVQGNIPQDLKWDVSVQDLIMKKYERLTRAVAGNHPDAIFWPETSVPGFLPDEEPLLERLLAISRDSKTYLLVGSPWVEEGLVYNSALLLKEGKILQRYDKLHLVPFGEFIPFEKTFPKLREWIFTGDFHAGKGAMVFRHPKGTFSVLICFEDVFPSLVRRFAEGSDFMVNITNDAWFGKSGAPFQHAQASVFRAIENRRSVLRVGNTGYTCLIDPAGRILRRLEIGSEPLFVTGFRTWDVPLFKEKSFYSRHGDLFGWLCTVTTFLGIALSLKTKPPRDAVDEQ